MLSGVIALLLLAAPTPPFEWTVPRVVGTLNVPGETWADGTPVRLRAYKSREKPENIFRDFISAARKQGLYIPPASRQPHPLWEAQLTALDSERKISHTLILQPEADGTVAVIVAEAQLFRRERRAGNTDLPIPPGASAPLVARLEGMELISFDVPAAVDALGFYRSVLVSSGFVEVEAGVFQGGQRELSLRVGDPRAEAGRRDVVVTRRSRSATEAQASGR